MIVIKVSSVCEKNTGGATDGSLPSSYTQDRTVGPKPSQFKPYNSIFVTTDSARMSLIRDAATVPWPQC